MIIRPAIFFLAWVWQADGDDDAEIAAAFWAAGLETTHGEDAWAVQFAHLLLGVRRTAVY